MRRMPQQYERNPLSLGYSKFSDSREPFAAKIDICLQHQRVWAGDGANAFVGAPDPGDNGTIIKADSEPHAHAYLPAFAHDHANHVRFLAARRHAIDHRYRAIFSFVVGFQHERVFTISALDALNFGRRA